LFTYLWLACAASDRVERAAFAACPLRRLLLPALAGQSLPDSLNLRLQILQVSFEVAGAFLSTIESPL
jgi:hypothetical protein